MNLTGVVLLLAQLAASCALLRSPAGRTADKLRLSAVGSAPELADALGVQRGDLDVPRWMWRNSWKIHSRLLPLLHFGDKAAAKDNCLSLKVLWCKSISALDRRSPAFDGGITYGMLPSVSRWVILKLLMPVWLAPRWYHYNIELRTVFLDKAVKQTVAELPPGTKVRLVSLGSGYDTRSIRFLTDGTIDAAYELDVKDVIDAKSIMMERLLKRKPNCILPTACECDLNNSERLEEILSEIVKPPNDDEQWHTIFLTEGLMIYLKPEVSRRMLQLCASQSSSSSLIFADRLELTYEDDTYEKASAYLRSCGGWKLDADSWCIKPGFARHMGNASLL